MRVVVLGAGYAGVTLARRLDSRLPPDVELVVVDEDSTHLVQHELHRVVRYPELESVIQVPLRELFDHAHVITERVESVDRDARTVHLEDGETLSYDYLAVCLGAETAYYGLSGVEEHALPLKRIEDAHAVRESFLKTCESGGTAVVGGAGLSGVQVAGELRALADEGGGDANVILLEQLDSVAPSFPEPFQNAVRKELERIGVEVRTGTTVERATADVVETDHGDIEYGTFVWTGGITGSAAMADERPLVRNDLRLDRRTFVVGDAARAVDTDGEAVPASASAAIREAQVVADNLLKLVRHDQEAGPDDFEPRMAPYRFEVPGWIVSIGDGTVAQVGPSVLRGAAARAMKATVGAGHLSSVGAVQNAVDLVEAELGPRARDDGDRQRRATPDAADVVDGLDRSDDGPIEIRVDDEPSETDDVAIDDQRTDDSGESSESSASGDSGGPDDSEESLDK